MAQYNVPISLADTLSPLIRNVFSDSQIVMDYSCCRTKSTCLLNFAIAEDIRRNLVDTMKTGP